MEERPGLSILRVHLGAALQKHRLRRNLTQAELADYAGLSLKYVGQIERGEANTTLEVVERLSAAVGWNPMDALDGQHEPLSEGVRQLLLEEVQQFKDRLMNMMRWLQALDPALNRTPQPPHTAAPRESRPKRRRKKGGDAECAEA